MLCRRLEFAVLLVSSNIGLFGSHTITKFLRRPGTERSNSLLFVSTRQELGGTSTMTKKAAHIRAHQQNLDRYCRLLDGVIGRQLVDS